MNQDRYGTTVRPLAALPTSPVGAEPAADHLHFDRVARAWRSHRELGSPAHVTPRTAATPGEQVCA